MSLFGNSLFTTNNNNNQQQGNNIFQNNNKTNNTTSNLFSNNNTNNTSLFSNNNTNNTSIFSFGSNNNNKPSTNLFGNPTSNNTSLFGNPNNNTAVFGQSNNNNSTNLFGNAAPASGNNTGLFGQQSNQLPNNQAKDGNIFNLNNNPSNTSNNNFNNMAYSNNSMNYNEILSLLMNFLNSYDPSKPANLFKFFLYNEFPQNQDPRNFISYLPYIKTEDGTINCIDFDLWNKSYQENKKPHLFYPFQISSTRQLLSRLKGTEIYLLTLLEDTVKQQQKMEEINQKYSKDISKELNNAREKMKIIKELLCKVSSNLANLSLKVGKLDKNLFLEKAIEDKIKYLKIVLNNEGTIKKNIKELNDLPSFDSNYGVNEYDEENNYMKDMNKERMDKNINGLAQIQELIEKQLSNLSNNMKTVYGIEKDLTELRKYGKIN